MHEQGINLTSHERHARLVKIVRKTYQAEHPGARLFPNVSGSAWQGSAVSGAGKVELLNPRPVFFGIPEPSKGSAEKKSGGADLLGWTQLDGFIPIDEHGTYAKRFYSVFTCIEVKTGKANLMKNQKDFRNLAHMFGCLYYVARECPACWDAWEPIYRNGKIEAWEIFACPVCGGKGFLLEGWDERI